MSRRPMEEFDFTPVRRGKFYGSPRCCGAKFCRYDDYLEATKSAATLAVRMGAGWEPVVWENLGWHYEVRNGIATVKPYINRNRASHHVEGYSAWLEIEHAGGLIQVIEEAKEPEDALGIATQKLRGLALSITATLNAVLAH